MAVQVSKSTILGWLGTTNEGILNQVSNILESIYFKAEGKIVKTITEVDDKVTITFSDDSLKTIYNSEFVDTLIMSLNANPVDGWVFVKTKTQLEALTGDAAKGYYILKDDVDDAHNGSWGFDGTDFYQGFSVVGAVDDEKNLRESADATLQNNINAVALNVESGGSVSEALFGASEIYKTFDFNSSGPFNGYSLCFIPKYVAKYDGEKLNGIRFRSSEGKIEIHVIDWTGNTSDALTIIREILITSISANQYFDNFDLTSHNIILEKGQRIMIKSAINTFSPVPDGVQPVSVFDDSNVYQNEFTGVALQLFTSVDETYTNVTQALVDIETSRAIQSENEIIEDVSAIKIVSDNLNDSLKGINTTYETFDFNSSTSFNSNSGFFVPDFVAQYDNTKINSARFRTVETSFQISVVNWTGNIADPLTIFRSLTFVDTIDTNTYYDNFDLRAHNIVLQAGQRIMIRSFVSNLVPLPDGVKPVSVFNSNNEYQNEFTGTAIKLFYTVEPSYEAKKVQNSYILENKLNNTTLYDMVQDSTLPILDEVDGDGIRLYQFSLDGGPYTTDFNNGIKLPFTKGRRYGFACKFKYNKEDAIDQNTGHGFALRSDNGAFKGSCVFNYRIPIKSKSIGFNDAFGFIDFNEDSELLRLVYRVYPDSSRNSSEFCLDVTIKDFFLFDLGEIGSYFHSKPNTYFHGLLRNRTFFDSLLINDVADKNINSLYAGLPLNSLGNSLPETRSFQYHVANYLGAYYDNDVGGTVDIDGTSTTYLPFTIGGTWCAPVTTAGGGAQVIEKSAYMRARFLKHKPRGILLIQCLENDSHGTSTPSNSIYGGKNPDGSFPYDFGVNDEPYTGNGVDVSDGVFQDSDGINLVPSLGAAMRGMLIQICTENPFCKVVIIGVPRALQVNKGSDSFLQNNYDVSIAKNNLGKLIAEEFSLPFVDLFNSGGYNAYNYDVHAIDAIHYSSEGGRKVAMTVLKDAF